MSLRLKAIIALMSMALLGLVYIQFYWIDSAISLKEDEFRQKVHVALNHVVKDLEKIEALEKFRQHQVTKRLIHQKMHRRKQAILQQQLNCNPIYGTKKWRICPSNDGNGSVIIAEQLTRDSSTRIVSRQFAGNNFSGASVQIDINMGDPTRAQNPEMDSVIDVKIDHRAAVIDDIFFDLMQNDVMLSIHDRIHVKLLDSLLKQRLKEEMIETEMRFGVFDYFGRLVDGMGFKEDLNALRTSFYKARLFPNDFFGDPFFISLTFPNQKKFLLKSMWFTLSISTLFILLIIGAFAYTIQVIQNQKQLSIIKNDFINNMTHELKTPISTISLACEALSDESLSKDKQRKNKFLQMIAQENNRLGGLVQNVLESSIWDKSDFKMDLEKVSLHDVIKHAAETAEILINQKQGELTIDLRADHPEVNGDQVHLTNVLNNLIDNGIKYSGDKPSIHISTINEDAFLVLHIKDNGLGISKEHQKKIFEKFYRVPKGNLHNVKGFGLGLNYVLNVIKAHHGTIEVKSIEGKGSTFTIRFPYI